MLKRYTAMILCLMLLCASARAETLVKKWPETGEPFGEDVETMRVIVMGIGAKDSFLIQCGGENMLIDSGILAIWNFAPKHLNVPDHILVQNENMAASLALLCKHLNEQMKAEE